MIIYLLRKSLVTPRCLQQTYSFAKPAVPNLGYANLRGFVTILGWPHFRKFNIYFEILNGNPFLQFSIRVFFILFGGTQAEKSWEPLLKSQKQKVTFHSSMQILVSLLTNWLLLYHSALNSCISGKKVTVLKNFKIQSTRQTNTAVKFFNQ